MTELQKEYCEEKGLIYIKPENTEISDYVNWLETQIQALRIHDVVGRSEQLCDHPTPRFCKGAVSGSFTLDDMRKAFEGGRDSVEAELKYEHFGDMDAYASKKIVKSFKTFMHENYR